MSQKISNPEVPSGDWVKTTYHIPTVTAGPKIDGKLDDACWKNALHANGFFRFRSKEPIKEQTEAWICADKSRIYFAFHCLDSHPELIRAHETQRDGNLDNDDYVGLAIDSQGNRRNVSQFTVNARGTQTTQLEGGTAENIAWAGDWTAATQRTPDGWTCEISIPFALLRYPKGAKNFPIALIRQLPRETNAEIWPYIPVATGDVNPVQYLNDFVGIEPPYYAPRLVYLPYVLGTAGKKSTLTEGLDIKYPISTTLTGIATIHPDFDTVERAVQDLSFSYTEKFLPDHRPFFAEGSKYLPDSFLFYSQRIPNVDEGLKVVGKQGPTSIGALATTARDGVGQSAFLANIQHELGLFSSVGAAVLGTNIDGLPANRVTQIGGSYGWMNGPRQTTLSLNGTKSWLAGGTEDYNDYFKIASDGGRNRISGQAYYTETGPKFTNDLGLVSEVDVKGGGMTFNRNGAHDKGAVERDYFEVNGSSFRHMTGGFFHDSVSAVAWFGMRNGMQFEMDGDIGKREDFHDNTLNASVSWNQKTLFQRGHLGYQFGHRENKPYQFMNVGQGMLVARGFSLQADYNRFKLGSFEDSQTVLSGTFRLNAQETFGGRLVQHGSQSNLYLSYGRRTRSGADIFVLVGDPNSPTTRGVITVKLVRAF